MGYISEFLWADEREQTSTVKRIYEHNSWQKAYAMGYREPRFPVPVVMQHFEFGWSLSDSEPVLMHVVRGPYT